MTKEDGTEIKLEHLQQTHGWKKMKIRYHVRAARDEKPKEIVSLKYILLFSSILISIAWYLCSKALTTEKYTEDKELHKQQFLESEIWREEEVSRVYLSRQKLVSPQEFNLQVSSGNIFAEYAQLFQDPGMILFGKLIQ